ncbi:MAG: hypothetical protein KGH69_04435 [Candidatus Micrarchaeota archaeon]|nr:hypothetical protein [Candidatus Micrarchaeota archaeon]
MSFMASAMTELSTIAILLMSLALAMVLTLKWMLRKSASMLFWSMGLWLFAIGMLFEVLFAYGIYSVLLANVYLFSVALLVEALALGSVQFVKSRLIRRVFYAYTVAATLFVAYSLMTVDVGNILVNGVVAGMLPAIVAISSSFATVPAAVVIAGMALKSYLSTKNLRMVSIMLGVIEVSIAGTLYIASFPAFLYFAEFAGIVLLWLGFMPSRKG